ncbi:uncharacterized protein [Halyomorpha halys]|uniref:uncharacterized protein n=1 Tax=Halyomorpha halys TaxID=286706 RepID=UPI0006D4F39C|nr:uncharacterized protein LOC106690248 [Halyomorpha halys]
MISIVFLISCIGFTIAGEGGFVYLINLSGSNWKKTHQEYYAMKNWGFPTLVKTGEAELVYIEFGNFPFLHVSHAQVEYELVGTEGQSFQVLAHGRPNRLEVVYNNLEIDGHPKGMSRNLGWRHNGDTNVIIIERNGTYTGNSLDTANWMNNNIEALGTRPLKQISIPGSHDAGMSKLDGHTAFGRACNVLTQSHSIGKQLNLGIRYFDIRPVIGNGGKFLTGHYTEIPGSWQGGNGQSIASIINDLNVFTKDHNELIMIKLSHSINTDFHYRKFTQAEWEKLFQELDAINYLYSNDESDVHLDQITLDDYTNHGSRASVVIIVDDPNSKVELGRRTGRGYFMPSSLDIFDDYSESNHWGTMIHDQIKKMKQHSDKQYFLLSWTLTQSDVQAVLCKPTVRDLADKANNQLGKLLYNEVSTSSFPNIILIDNVKDTNVALMALAINTKITL